MKRRLVMFVWLVVFFGILAQGAAQNRLTSPSTGYVFENIVEFAEITEGFSVLASILKGSTLGQELRAGGTYLLIAPTDEAFASVPQEELAMFLDDPERLDAFLRAHVLRLDLAPGGLMNALSRQGTIAPRSLGGAPTVIERSSNGALTVAGTAVAGAELVAGNGSLLVVDVLPELASAGAAFFGGSR